MPWAKHKAPLLIVFFRDYSVIYLRALGHNPLEVKKDQ